MTHDRGRTTYLELEEVLQLAEDVLGAAPGVRDAGLLAAAAERPRTDVFGSEVYPRLAEKAAALLHSLARNHALLDGNKRTAWASCLVMLDMNDIVLKTPDPVTEGEFVLEVARGELDVPGIAQRLRDWGAPD